MKMRDLEGAQKVRKDAENARRELEEFDSVNGGGFANLDERLRKHGKLRD